MISIDTGVLKLVFHGDPVLSARLASVPIFDQGVPVVVMDELFRGRLAAIRTAESGKGSFSLTDAYDLFAETIAEARRFLILRYTASAELFVAAWKPLKLRIGMKDQRIAAVCIVHGATLVTRNARDYALVPGLQLDVWT